jgi:hypothetical protein
MPTKNEIISIIPLLQTGQFSYSSEMLSMPYTSI